MTTRKLDTKIFGREVEFEYSDSAIGYSLLLLRIGMGWVLFQGGIVKVLDPSWSAAGFLTYAIPEGNPLVGFWASMAGNPMIDALNAWGLTLTGLGLMLGALVRWNAFWAAVMMLFYWAASLTGGVGQFLPLEHGWVVDDHLLYAFLLFGLGAFGAGRIVGVDGYIEKMKVIKENPKLAYLFG